MVRKFLAVSILGGSLLGMGASTAEAHGPYSYGRRGGVVVQVNPYGGYNAYSSGYRGGNCNSHNNFYGGYGVPRSNFYGTYGVPRTNYYGGYGSGFGGFQSGYQGFYGSTPFGGAYGAGGFPPGGAYGAGTGFSLWIGR